MPASVPRARTRPRPLVARLVPVLAIVPVAIAGCSSTGAPAAAPRTTAPAVSSAAAAAQRAQYAGNTPPEAAQMVCSDEIRGEVADALGMAANPTPTSAWADHVYTCDYALPMGRLVLAVSVSPSNSAARDELATLRRQAAADAQEAGLGQQAYSAPAGPVLAVKDNMVLRVDATGMPDDLGATHEHRLDLARVIAAGVFNCWTGNS